MANRYANLVGSNKIKDEWQKINTGFDLVQADMDAKPDSSIAQVNDIELDADDTLTIEGGTGITVTTIPEQKKMRIVATGTSTPGPHAIEHITGGSDVIPNATTSVSGLMSAADKAKLDGATSAATPNTLVQRDANGRFKATAPSASDDVARKAEVDALEAKTIKNLTRIEIQDLGETSVLAFTGGIYDDQFIVIRITCPRASNPQNPGNTATILCTTQHRHGLARYITPINTSLASGTITIIDAWNFEVSLPTEDTNYTYRIQRAAASSNFNIRSTSGIIPGKTIVEVAATSFI